MRKSLWLLVLVAFAIVFIVGCGGRGMSSSSFAPGSSDNSGSNGAPASGGSGNTGQASGTSGSGTGSAPSSPGPMSTHFVYLGGGYASFTITGFKFDSTSGASSSIGSFATAGALNPGALAQSPDAKYLIASSAQIHDKATAGADELDVYSIDHGSGTLRPVYKDPGISGSLVWAKSYLILDSSAGFQTYSMKAGVN